jgi:hypothetical protein
MISGTIFLHLTKIGIYFAADPVLFFYAVIAFICFAALIFAYWNRLRDIVARCMYH